MSFGLVVSADTQERPAQTVPGAFVGRPVLERSNDPIQPDSVISENDILFRGEVVEEGPRRDIGGRSDIVDRCPVEAAAFEEVERYSLYLAACSLLLGGSKAG